MLSFKHEVFLEVASQLSFTKASQILFISQPAISKHIRQLEEEYKASLFERKGSTIALTEAGKMLVESLQKVKALEKNLEIELNTYRDSSRIKGELKLGASTTVALYIVPPVLSKFRKKYPDTRLSLFNRNSESVLQALLNHEIDLGIVEGPNKLSQVKSQLFLTDEVVPVCSAQSELARKPTWKITDIPSLPVALRERGSGTLAVLKLALGAKGIKMSDLKISMRLGGTEALKNFLLADDSMGFLPARAVTKELARGELVRLFIDGLTITRQFYFIQRHGDENRGLNAIFIKMAKSHYNIKL
ncbi:MAG: LysR family transcriptional regulator [Bacteroidetes bacterium CHB5]|nr:LysR family transcriptional regulator [Bacteroidetes bacterium CHB5]